MRAITYEKYGSPDVLQFCEIEKPLPNNHEVLIKVKAVSINASDLEFLNGKPVYTRVWGFFQPGIRILGSDISGTVEAIGKNATQFKPGVEVFGDIMGKWGGLAQYVCVPENKLMLKPLGITHEEAAAIPQSSMVALHGLREKGKIQPGQKVLINGAGGGSGSFAIQLAKMYGTEVTGVDNAEKQDLMKSLGADYVIDYAQTDFTHTGQKYDLILDLVASHSIFNYKRTLKTGGRYVMAGGSMLHIFSTLIFGSWISLTSSKKMGIVGVKPNKDVPYMVSLVESGKVKPVIDKLFPFNKAPEAFWYFARGHAKGKVVISVEQA